MLARLGSAKGADSANVRQRGISEVMGTIGIYLNPSTRQAFRASTVHAAPEGPDWVLLSEDSMIGMVRVRELAKERSLVAEPDTIQWTGRTDQPPAASGESPTEA
ncbi:MAG: hypothetical protein ACR2PL_23640 [Dehalococcoidia bacterium]